jgi:hypothetical protein
MRRSFFSTLVFLLAAAILGGCGGKTDNEGIGDAAFPFIRAINANVDAPTEAFTIGSVLLANNLPYSESSPLLGTATFNTVVDIKGNIPDSEDILIDQISDVEFKTNVEYSIISSGFVDDPASFIVENPRRRRPIAGVYVQFAHAAPLQGDMAIYLTAPDADLSASAPWATLPFTGSTVSQEISPGEYQVRVIRVSDGELIFDSGSLFFERDAGAPDGRGGREWFMCFMEKPDLLTAWPMRMLLTDGFSNFDVTGTGATSAQSVYHAAREVGPVDVFLDGDLDDPLASGLDFLQKSDYRAIVPADGTQVTLTSPGNPADVLLDETLSVTGGAEQTLFVLDTLGGAGSVTRIDDDRRPVVTSGRLGLVLATPENGAVSVFRAESLDEIDIENEEYGTIIYSRIPIPTALPRRSLLPGQSNYYTFVQILNVDDDDPVNDEPAYLFGPVEVVMQGSEVKSLLLLDPPEGSPDGAEAVLIDDLE